MQATSSRSMARKRLRLALIAAVIATTAAIAVPASASAAASGGSTTARDHCSFSLPVFGCLIPGIHLPNASLPASVQEGQPAACNGGTFPNIPIIGNVLNGLPRTYSFRRNGSQVALGSSSSYTPVEADINQTLTCVVTVNASFTINFGFPIGTHTVNFGTLSTGVSPGRVVQSANLINTGAPSISGSGVEGTTLTCNNGSFSPSSSLSHSYSWFRSGVLGAVSTGQTRTVSPADVGSTLTCRDTATRHGKTAFGTSAPKAATAAAITNTAPPTITGGSQEGQGVTCNAGSWSHTPESSSFEWVRNGSVIASGASYTLAGADVGQQVKCRENVSRLGQSSSADSAAITPSAKPVVNNNTGTTNTGTTNQGTSTPTNTNAAKKRALARKRAAAIRRCNKKFKKKSQRKKRAACVKKAKKKYAFKG